MHTDRKTIVRPHAKPNSRQQRHIAPCVSLTALLSSPLSPSSGPERLSACASAYEYACVNSNRGVGVGETPVSVASQHVLMRGDTGILMYRKACGRASTKTQHHLVVSKGVSSGCIKMYYGQAILQHVTTILKPETTLQTRRTSNGASLHTSSPGK